MSAACPQAPLRRPAAHTTASRACVRAYALDPPTCPREERTGAARARVRMGNSLGHLSPLHSPKGAPAPPEPLSSSEKGLPHPGAPLHKGRKRMESGSRRVGGSGTGCETVARFGLSSRPLIAASMSSSGSASSSGRTTNNGLRRAPPSFRPFSHALTARACALGARAYACARARARAHACSRAHHRSQRLRSFGRSKRVGSSRICLSSYAPLVLLNSSICSCEASQCIVHMVVPTARAMQKSS